MEGHMNPIEVRCIIESTLKGGSKMPGLFDLPKIMGIKSKLESCSSINEVVCVLEEYRSLISKSFGLNDAVLDESVAKIKSLDVAA